MSIWAQTKKYLYMAAAGGLLLGSSAIAGNSESEDLKVMQLPIRTDGPKSLDPIEGSTTYDNMACVQFYETLLTNKYTNPMEMEPLLLSEMPTTSDEGTTWHFKLKSGVYFQDNECFPNGKGRLITPDDVFYSLKRLADDQYQLENWWLLDGAILGFNEYKDTQNAADKFDYSAQVEGFRKINDLEFEIVLTKPVYRFLYILSMFQTSIVAQEAVDFYGEDFARNPVGTGPFVLDSWVPKQSLTANRNPNYHPVFYPDRSEWSKADKRNRLHRAGGEQVPFVDRIEFTMFVEDQPMWLEFSKGKLGYSQVPEEYYTEAFDLASKELNEDLLRKGIRPHSNLLLDFTFRGFNMEDDLLGGYTPEKIALRRAISYAIDLEEINKTFYNGRRIVYDGPIPPGLDGHPENHRSDSAARGPNLSMANQKLAEAGYPNGEGLPPIRFVTSQNTLNNSVAEMLKRQLAQANIQLDSVFLDFSTLIENINKKKAPMFGFAWASDYPDAENNLALFYGPNESPGSNHYNYKRPEYDALYEQVLTMSPSDERTAIYEQMRDMVLEDCVYVGGMARERFYLINPWLTNCKPTERYYGWFKFLDVDDEARD
ncbi:MAG: ABC transporter substrate-binding protein [Phycisphaerales bacterium]|nr:ABC transporter substrate-binding protein [Phycisphaerales bacterium]